MTCNRCPLASFSCDSVADLHLIKKRFVQLSCRQILRPRVMGNWEHFHKYLIDNDRRCCYHIRGIMHRLALQYVGAFIRSPDVKFDSLTSNVFFSHKTFYIYNFCHLRRVVIIFISDFSPIANSSFVQMMKLQLTLCYSALWSPLPRRHVSPGRFKDLYKVT